MAEEEDKKQKSPISELAAELRKQTGSARKAMNVQTDLIDVAKKIGDSVIRLEQLAKINTVNAEKLRKESSTLSEGVPDQLFLLKGAMNNIYLGNVILGDILEVLDSQEDMMRRKNLKEKRGLSFDGLGKSIQSLRDALTGKDSKKSSGGGGSGPLGSLGSSLKGIASGAADSAKSIAMIGIAIPAFLGGLAIGSKVLEGMSGIGIGDLDFAGLKKGMTGLSSMISSLDRKTILTLGGLIGISAYAGTKGSNGYDSALSLGLMGASVVAFLGGLAIGSTVLESASTMGIADLDFAGLKKGFSGLGSIIGDLDQQTVIILGGLIGLAGYAGAKGGAKVAASISLMGLALTAFIGGLAFGNSLLADGDPENLNFSSLGKAFNGLSNSITNLSTKAVISLGAIVGIAGAFTKIRVPPIRFGLMMAMIGVGITGFLGGLALGELVLSKAGGAGIDLDFPAVAAALSGFSNVVGALTPGSVLALGAIVGAAAVLTKLNVAPLKFGASMLMIGAGLSGFLGGFAIGDLVLKEASVAGIDLEFPSIKTAIEGFNGIADSISLKSIAVLGTLVGSALILSKGGFATGAKFASSMIFIGAGIAGLLGGFVIGEMALGNVTLETLKFEGIKAAVTGFSDVMSAVDVKAFAGLATIMATAALLTAGSFATGPKFALAMTFIGAGIAGFLAGLGIGEVAVKAVGKISDLNFSSIKEAFAGFDSIMGELSGGTLTAMAGLMAAGGILALVGGFGGGPAFAIAMTGIGAGIGGFLIGFDGVAAAGGALGLDGSAIADLMTNIAVGAQAFDGIDMVGLSAGIALLGPAMLLLMGAEGIGGLASGLAEGAKSAWNFITGKGDEDKGSGGIFGQISKTLGDPSQLDMDAIGRLTKSIDEGEVNSFVSSMGKITKALKEFAGDEGFFASLGTAFTSFVKGDPFKPFLKIADKGDELFKAGIGLEKLSDALNNMGSTKYDKKTLNSVVAFAKDIGKEQDKLDKAASSLKKIADSLVSINEIQGPSGAIMAIGNENVNLSGDMMVSQASLDNMKAESGSKSNNIVAPMTTTSNNSSSTVNNYSSAGQPSTTDYTDYKTSYNPVAR